MHSGNSNDSKEDILFLKNNLPLLKEKLKSENLQFFKKVFSYELNQKDKGQIADGNLLNYAIELYTIDRSQNAFAQTVFDLYLEKYVYEARSKIDASYYASYVHPPLDRDLIEKEKKEAAYNVALEYIEYYIKLLSENKNIDWIQTYLSYAETVLSIFDNEIDDD